MKISDFTQDYIDLFREKCNFTDTERLERSMLRDMIYDLNNENWNE